MTAPDRQPRDWDDTAGAEAEGFAYDVPPVLIVDRLIRWYEARAGLEGRLALSLEVQGLPVAADANRKRVVAYRQTVACLRALRERCCEPAPVPEAAFRGHLQAKPRQKAQVRAPP